MKGLAPAQPRGPPVARCVVDRLVSGMELREFVGGRRFWTTVPAEAAYRWLTWWRDLAGWSLRKPLSRSVSRSSAPDP